jgi:hypothetical protein
VDLDVGAGNDGRRCEYERQAFLSSFVTARPVIILAISPMVLLVMSSKEFISSAFSFEEIFNAVSSVMSNTTRR